MAGTERELRELKWLLSSSSARLDGQHRSGRGGGGRRAERSCRAGRRMERASVVFWGEVFGVTVERKQASVAAYEADGFWAAKVPGSWAMCLVG